MPLSMLDSTVPFAMYAPKQLHITEVAFAKNEGRFLLEWIAYHRVIGVTDFLIYTNDCEDGSPDLLDRLQELGIVIHVQNQVAPGERPQNMALNLAADHHVVKHADYVLQIDPDEFLCINAGEGLVADLIDTAPEADVICVQMRFFGDGGLPCMPQGLVMEAFTRCSQEGLDQNRNVKSLARNGGPFFKITANHMPGFFAADGQHPRIFNCGGAEISPEAYGGERFRMIPDAFRSMKFAQLNHYSLKTIADYNAKRYRGTAAGNDKKFTRKYWTALNRNEVEDTKILRHLSATKALMQEWLRDPVLAARNLRCFEAYDEILRKSQRLFGADSEDQYP
jgi:hypothetical protein